MVYSLKFFMARLLCHRPRAILRLVAAYVAPGLCFDEILGLNKDSCKNNR